jgi:hypothetical protein
MYDKIIHAQRMRLKALLREKDQAEVAAREARVQAEHSSEKENEISMRPAARRSAANEHEMPLTGADVVRKVVPLLRTRRGAMALALVFLALIMMYSSQKGVDSSGIAPVGQEQTPGDHHLSMLHSLIVAADHVS